MFYCVIKACDVDAIQQHGSFSTEKFGRGTDRAKIRFSTLDPSIRCVQYRDEFKYIKPYDGKEPEAVQKAYNKGEVLDWPAILTDATGAALDELAVLCFLPWIAARRKLAVFYQSTKLYGVVEASTNRQEPVIPADALVYAKLFTKRHHMVNGKQELYPERYLGRSPVHGITTTPSGVEVLDFYHMSKDK